MSKTALIFEKQALHAALLAALASSSFWAAGGLQLSEDAQLWFGLALGSAVLHQGWVWLCWRLELHIGWLSRTFGPAGFRLYGAGFALLAASRFVALIKLAAEDRGSIVHYTGILRLLGILALPVIAYLFYSVGRYFTYRRALGADHFDPEYRTMPLEKRGIFRFSNNAMYTYGFLAVWLPGLFAASAAALLAAAFHHAYIWVHYFCTEKPDMVRIYGSAEPEHQ